MRRALIVIAMLCAACATRPSSDFQSGDAERVIRRYAADFTNAVNRADVDRIVALYGDSAVLMPPNAPAFHGKDGVRQFWTGFLGIGKIEGSITTDDVIQSGDVAVERGHYELTITPKGATTSVKDSGKYLIAWQRSDKDWRIERDMFSSDLPAAR